MKLVKGSLLFLLLFFLTTSVVLAKEVKIYYYADGADKVSDNIYIDNNLIVLKDTDSYYATYDINDTIVGFNNIDGQTFSISKEGKSLASGVEWYGYDTREIKHYYSSSKSYKISDIAKELGVYNDNMIMINLHANFGEDNGSNNNDSGSTNTELVLKRTDYKFRVGGYTVLKFKNSDVNPNNLKWSSSNENVVTVNSGGGIKGKSVGKAVITVEDDYGHKASCNIEVVGEQVHNIYIKYNLNGGKLNDLHGDKITTSSNTIKCNGSDICQTIVYGSTTVDAGLYNYNNPNYLNIYRKGYIIKSKSAWNTKKNGKGKDYSQSVLYKGSDFCDASKKDCTITLYANWQKASKEYKIALIGNSKTKYMSVDTSRVSTIFEQLVSKAGYNAKVTTIVKGGSTLLYKAETDKYKKQITQDNFNYVVLQEQTDNAASNLTEYKNGAIKVVGLLKNKKANVFVRTAWPRLNSKFDENVNNMVINTNAVASAVGGKPIYDGLAFKEAKENNMNIYLKDNNHPTTEGAYMAAACIYKKVFKVKAITINYYNGINANTAQKLLMIADKNC